MAIAGCAANGAATPPAPSSPSIRAPRIFIEDIEELDDIDFDGIRAAWIWFSDVDADDRDQFELDHRLEQLGFRNLCWGVPHELHAWRGTLSLYGRELVDALNYVGPEFARMSGVLWSHGFDFFWDHGNSATLYMPDDQVDEALELLRRRGFDLDLYDPNG